jgi:hypothetical protein
MNESLVYLQDVESRKVVEASLFDEVTDDHLLLWENGWVTEMPNHDTNTGGCLPPQPMKEP